MNRLRSWIGTAACAAFALAAVPHASVSYAREGVPTVVKAVPAEKAQVRPALWKIADEDTTIWLFGTIHILPQEVEWYAGPIATAFDSSNELVTEIMMDDANKTSDLFKNLSARQDGKTLRATLSAPDLQAYEAAMTKLFLPVDIFDHSDAWFAAMILTMLPLKKAGFDTDNGIDSQVVAKARARQMPNTALETIGYQIGLFEALSASTQKAYLAEVIRMLPTMNSAITEMIAAWKIGDAENLAQLMNEDESDPEMRKVLLTDRNIKWAKWLKNRLEQPGSVFVAVGAGHLAGPGSVQEQLAAEGISSTRVQ